MPLHPYHAPSQPLHVSCQDSEVQSMVSVAYSDASVHRNRLAKLDPVIKKSLEANEHLKQANVTAPALEMSQMSISGTGVPQSHAVHYTAAEKEEKRKRFQVQNTNYQDIAQLLIEKLEDYIKSLGKRVIYDENKRDKVAELPLPKHLRHDMFYDDQQSFDESQQHKKKQNKSHYHSYSKQSESTNRLNSEQMVMIDQQFQNYQYTFKSKEVSITINIRLYTNL